MATIRQVAEQAGVSAMTVSNVLNGVTGACTEGTRQRVLRAVEKLDYRANALPKAMRAGEFGIIALVATVHQEGGMWLPTRLVDAVHDGLEAAGKHLLLCKVDVRDLVADDPARAPRLMRETHADGVLINGMSQANADLIAAALRQYPVVFLNQRRARDAVHPDDRAAGRAAYEYLRRNGARRLGYLAQYGGAHSSMPDRLEGFRSAAEADRTAVRVIAPAAGTIATPGATLESLADLALADDLDGICCYSDREAAALCRRALERGLDRTRLRIATFSDAPYAFGAWQVATWVLPIADVGREGVAMLAKRIASGRSCPARAIPIPLQEPPWAWPVG